MSLNKTSTLSQQQQQQQQQQTTSSSGISSSFGSAFQPISDNKNNQSSVISPPSTTKTTTKNNEYSAGFDLSDGFGAIENTGNGKKSSLLVSPPNFNINKNKVDTSGLNLSGFAGSNISDIIGNLNDDQQQQEQQHDRSIFSSFKPTTTDVTNKGVQEKSHPSSAFSPPASSLSTHPDMASIDKQQQSSLFSQRSAFVTVESLKENEDKSSRLLSSSSITKQNTSNIVGGSKNILSPDEGDDLPKKRKSTESVESKLFLNSVLECPELAIYSIFMEFKNTRQWMFDVT